MHCQLWCSFLNIAWLLAAGCGQIALLKVSNEGSLIFEDEDRGRMLGGEDHICGADVSAGGHAAAAVSSLATL